MSVSRRPGTGQVTSDTVAENGAQTRQTALPSACRNAPAGGWGLSCCTAVPLSVARARGPEAGDTHHVLHHPGFSNNIVSISKRLHSVKVAAGVGGAGTMYPWSAGERASISAPAARDSEISKLKFEI
jgi:hypothetical protein